MFRHQLQHVILEIGRRFELYEFYIVGSVAILAAPPDPPVGSLTATRDVDVLPPGGDEQLADRLSFVLGETSDFGARYGNYAQGVSLSTPAYAPAGWQSRAIAIRVEDVTAWCMEPHDLILGKLGAGRDKDLDFARSASLLGLLSKQSLLDRLALVKCEDPLRELIAQRIRALPSPI